MVSARPIAPSFCVQKCASASQDFDLTNCNPSDRACLCSGESFRRAFTECVSTACPHHLPNADAFLGSQCAIATHSLLDPRQDAGATSVRSPSGTQTTATSLGSPVPSHKVNTAAIAGGVVGGLLTIALIAITMWYMRQRFRFRSKRMEEKQRERPPTAPVYADAERVDELRSPSVLELNRPIQPSVLAAQAAMWEKASSSPRTPRNTPEIDVAALLWDDPHGSLRSQSSGMRHIPTTQMQLHAMAERVAQVEVAMSARAALSPPVDELPPNYTQGP
ncbi:hypothetical protein B0H13DRAFT_2306692 [Mycena leptocephala]|nr:hypothetical protein B0H13DRAFT_2306692 [Mycena leptocephala]